MRISRVGIVAKPNSEEAARVALDAGRFLSSRGIEVIRPAELAKADGCGPNPPPADLVVVVGGDGTIMRTAQMVGSTPLLGIKVGARGFLCETIPEEAIATLTRVLEGKTYLEYKTKLSVALKGRQLPDALNEALVTSARPSKIIRFSVSADGKTIHRGMADGVIVSTTTGATAYALSAGGPIIDPGLDVIEVVFVCPLHHGVRPVILPPSARVEVTLLPGSSGGLLMLDGQVSVDLEDGEKILVEKSRSPAVFLRTAPVDFYDKVRKSLNMGFEG
ncbi:MAG: NAD(+)/NADH kinase [Candidatus Methanosuratincola sp.]|uniref:NAD kinase n=1 Tax=Methanosuratincola subterraneus TaxID=2593994 RepID=A0A3S4UG75_METS7|nr:NAD(+)/NADH kinase [Candidatus Methanosuratincola sp.]RWX73217.1 MAG: NAD kinase [Candidatus Methanosuratincola subterraneus]